MLRMIITMIIVLTDDDIHNYNENNVNIIGNDKTEDVLKFLL